MGQGTASLRRAATNGVVIATDKQTPSILVDEATVSKIQNLECAARAARALIRWSLTCLPAACSSHIGVTYAGMGPDFRVLAKKGRKAVQQYHLTYHDTPPVGQMVREVASVMQEFTQSG